MLISSEQYVHKVHNTIMNTFNTNVKTSIIKIVLRKLGFKIFLNFVFGSPKDNWDDLLHKI